MIIPISRMRKPWHRKVESKVQHVVNGEPDSDPDSPSSSVGLAHSKPLDSEASRLTSESISCSAVSDYLRPHGLQPTRRLCPWASPGKNTGVGCRFLLQGIFLTQGLNLGLQHCRQILYHLSHQGSPLDHLIVIFLSICLIRHESVTGYKLKSQTHKSNTEYSTL